MEELAVFPLAYRPFKYDDWGFIRTVTGDLFAIVRTPASEEELSRHRAARTDPYEPLARLLMEAAEAKHAREVAAAKGAA